MCVVITINFLMVVRLYRKSRLKIQFTTAVYGTGEVKKVVKIGKNLRFTSKKKRVCVLHV